MISKRDINHHYVPGLGAGTALLDIGNQLEFKVDCPLNGPSSRLLKKEKIALTEERKTVKPCKMRL